MPFSGPSLNGIAAIKAYPIAQLADRTMLWDSSDHANPKLYVFNSASTATDDDNLVLMPSGSPAAGRWIKHAVASGGGGVTVDSQIITTITIPATGPIFPALTPTVTPSAIGETRYVFRRYIGAAPFNGSQNIGLILTRSAYFTSIGLTASDWQNDLSGLIDIELTTENGNPIANDPYLDETSQLRIEPDYAGQRAIVRAASASFQFQNGARQARIALYDTGLPIAGSAAKWWEWGGWF